MDGRWFPWGDVLDPGWCRTRETWDARLPPDFGLANVDSYPIDVSPFGVRGMGGNVRDWCLDVEGRIVDERVAEPVLGDPDAVVSRVVRGGPWDLDRRHCRSADRSSDVPGVRYPGNGFRGLFVPVR